jgi:hypothetical protein
MMGIFLGMPLGSQVGGLVADQVGLPAVMNACVFALVVYIFVARRWLRGFADLDANIIAGSP